MLVDVVHTVPENLIIIKIRRLKSARAGACSIQILQKSACITQNQKDWKSFKLNHKDSH